MPVVLTALPDRKLVVKAELQALFDALGTQVNTTLLSPDVVDPNALEYRHLAYPPKIGLMIDKKPLTIDSSVAYGGWYVTDAQLRHASTHSSAPNGPVNNQGVVHVRALVGMAGAHSATYPTVPTQACIGYSTDNGATWVALPTATSRDLGYGSGACVPMYATRSMTHYMTGAAGYVPPNHPTDRAIELAVSFGGEGGVTVNPTTIDRYAIMMNGYGAGFSDNVFTLWGILELNARELGF